MQVTVHCTFVQVKEDNVNHGILNRNNLTREHIEPTHADFDETDEIFYKLRRGWVPL